MSKYPVNDPRRFLMGTPTQVWRTIERCWEIEPSSKRIMEDINALPRILDKIIAANGCVVPVTIYVPWSQKLHKLLFQDENLRSGRRYVSMKGIRMLKSRRRPRNCCQTMKAPQRHPDCEEAAILVKRDVYATIMKRTMLRQQISNQNVDQQGER
jgi:hypothetical protein